jgi:RNA-binding protein
MLTAKEKRRLRRVAHHLSPVAILAERGISAGLVAEVDRALRDHELIKVRVDIDDRALRRARAADLAQRCGADVVQTIGKVWVLYRMNPDAKPRLSNLGDASGLSARGQ